MGGQVKLLLHRMKRRKILMIVGLGIVGFVICLFVAGFSTPDMIDSKKEEFYACPNEKTFNCISRSSQQEFLIYVEDVDKTNNYLYFEVESEGKLIEKVFANFSITDEKNDEEIYNKYKEFNFGSNKSIISHLISHIKENNSKYKVQLKLFSQVNDLTSLTIRVFYLDSNFFIYLVTTKYFFFTYMLTFIIIFFIKTRKMIYRYLPFETYTSLMMCFSVLIFNEPLIAGYPDFSEISAISVSVFSNVQFICSLVLYWLFMLKKLNNPYCQKLIILVEFIFICSLFCLLFVIYVYVQSNLKYDDKYNWEKDLEGARKIIYQVIISILVLFATWMFILMVMSLRKWRGDELSYREKIYWAFNYILIIISFIFIGLGYIQKMEYGQILLVIVALYNIFFSILLYVSIPETKSYNDWIDDAKEQLENVNEENISGSELSIN